MQFNCGLKAAGVLAALGLNLMLASSSYRPTINAMFGSDVKFYANI